MFVFPCCLMPGTKGHRRKRRWHLERLCMRLSSLSLSAYSLRLIVLSVFSSSLCQILFSPNPPDHSLSTDNSFSPFHLHFLPHNFSFISFLSPLLSLCLCMTVLLFFVCFFHYPCFCLFILILFPYVNIYSAYWLCCDPEITQVFPLYIYPLHLFIILFPFSLSGSEKGRCVASEYFTEPEIEITTENTANILSKSHYHIPVYAMHTC